MEQTTETPTGQAKPRPNINHHTGITGVYRLPKGYKVKFGDDYCGRYTTLTEAVVARIKAEAQSSKHRARVKSSKAYEYLEKHNLLKTYTLAGIHDVVKIRVKTIFTVIEATRDLIATKTLYEPVSDEELETLDTEQVGKAALRLKTLKAKQEELQREIEEEQTTSTPTSQETSNEITY